jgi:hypothetical protein
VEKLSSNSAGLGILSLFKSYFQKCKSNSFKCMKLQVKRGEKLLELSCFNIVNLKT